MILHRIQSFASTLLIFIACMILFACSRSNTEQNQQNVKLEQIEKRIQALEIRIQTLEQGKQIPLSNNAISPTETSSNLPPKPASEITPDVKVVKAYLDAKTWEERLPYVRYPEKVKPLMQEWYKNFTGTTSYIEIQPSKKKDVKVGGWISVRAIFSRGKNGFGQIVEDARWYTLQKTQDGYLIDWESSEGYNPFTIKAYIVQKPTNPLKFRLCAKMDSTYSGYFLKKEDIYYNIRLEEAKDFNYLYGYILKNSEDGKRIFDILKDGEWHNVIVIIHHYPDSVFNFVIIDKFVKEYWYEE